MMVWCPQPKVLIDLLGWKLMTVSKRRVSAKGSGARVRSRLETKDDPYILFKHKEAK